MLKKRSEPGFVGLQDYRDYHLPRRRRLFARKALPPAPVTIITHLQHIFVGANVNIYKN